MWKANKGQGGVGYEKMILTAHLMKDIAAARVIPLVRGGAGADVVPTFLMSKLYIDFRDDVSYETRYGELLRNIHGEQVSPRPALGSNPFTAPPPSDVEPRLSFAAERYVSAGLSGEVVFDYSNNNGRYVVGAGDMAFETAWGTASNTSIHAYNDPASIRSVALAVGVPRIEDIADATRYDTSSRHRTAKTGEILVWQNLAGYYLATRIERISARSHGSARDEMVFTYVIAPSKHTDFGSRSPQATEAGAA